MKHSVAQKRRDAILTAGRKIILNVGLRAATMEAIAAEAGVAKPTLYKYFPDKAAIYDALAEAVIEEMKLGFDDALAREGTAAVRIAAALTAKKKFVFKLLHSSPHAAELGGEDAADGLEKVVAFERYVEGEVTRVLEEAGRKDARPMAQLLLACALGISKSAQFAEQIGPAIRLVVNKLLA
jgi:AcrR family transcriptional regulator